MEAGLVPLLTDPTDPIEPTIVSRVKDMKISMKMLTICCLLGSQMIAFQAFAAIPRALYKPIFFTVKRDYSHGLNITAIQPIDSLRDLDYASVQKIIPDDMTPTSDGGMVATQILDRSLTSFFNSAEVRRSDIGRTATRVERTLESDIALGGTKPESIKHSFKFAMRATQTKALVEYTGITNAQLVYHIGQDKLNFEVHESLAGSTQVVFNHITTPGDSTDILSMRWQW